MRERAVSSGSIRITVASTGDWNSTEKHYNRRRRKTVTVRTYAPPILLCCLIIVFTSSAHAADRKATPADYPLAMHISASTYASAANSLYEIVTATVDGKHYQLQGPTSSSRAFTHGNGLINPGDYHCKLSMDEHKTSYESLQMYEILLPDGTTRKFDVVAQSE